jgi:predicted nucleic acid-binding protein
MLAFWDASALVRLCVRDQSSPRAKKLLREANVVAWWATAVEGRGALVRLQREGLLPDAAFRVSCERLSALLSTSKEILPSNNVREIALQQLERFPLRAGDALQLAAALVWCGERPRGRWFVCDDRRLAAAAAAVGFEVQSV